MPDASTPPEQVATAPRGGLVSWAAGSLLALGAIVASTLHGTDLKVYRAGVDMYLHNPSHLYDPGLTIAPGYGLPFTYPPFAALALVPLGVLPFDVSILALTLLSLTLIYLVMRDLGPRVRALLPAKCGWLLHPALLTGLACWSAPFRDTFAFGQINTVLFGVIYLFCVRLGLGFVTGVVVGLFGGVKLTPLALGIVPLAQGRWRMILGMGTGFFGSVALMWFAAPELSSQYWLHIIRDPSRIGGLEYFDNISWQGVLSRLNLDFKGLWFLGCLPVLALAVAAMMGLREKIDVVAHLGLGAAAVLFISPVSWSHHATWLPVIVYALLSVAQATGRLRGPLLWTAWIFGILLGIGYRVLGQLSGRSANDLHSTVWNIFASLPALLLAAVVVLSFAAVVTMTERRGLFEMTNRFRRRSALPAQESTDPTQTDTTTED